MGMVKERRGFNSLFFMHHIHIIQDDEDGPGISGALVEDVSLMSV